MLTSVPIRFRRALLAGALTAAALPAGASAATVEIQGNDVLKYRGGSDRNTLSVREDGGALIVSDTAGVSNIFISLTDPRPRCAIFDSRTLRCPLRVNGRSIVRFEAELGDNHDIVRNLHTALPVIVSGGSGDDIYEAGNPPFLTRVDYRGGGGLDHVSYAGAGQSADGRGVRIDNDGAADDGRFGLDTDNVRPDVERLTGSAFGDELTGAGEGNDGCCHDTEVAGGPGDDVLRTGPGRFAVVFRMGPAVDGADRVIGGARRSIVDYSARTRPVDVTPDSGGANDGETGEGDEIAGGHDMVAGGKAGDTLRAPRFSTTPYGLVGGEGDDTLDGADGDDAIRGEAGADVIRAFGGDDHVFVDDGARDVIGCGLGTDSIVVDLQDSFEACESRRLVGAVGVLRLAPKTLRARVGKVVRVGLSWRHPRAWKQLRHVELRLYNGATKAGRVTMRPHGSRIEVRGVRLVRRASRLTRRGKTVSAHLALRLPKQLAGRRLRIEVAAVDIRGRRQVERRAGSIRVAR